MNYDYKAIRSVSDPEIEAVRNDIARKSDRGSALLIHLLTKYTGVV
jgi:hypothetical protein